MEARPPWVLSLLLALAAITLFVGLGANSIWDANEAFYVDTPRQMVLSGDYVNPVFNGQPRLNKPVLSYWVVAALYQLFGISVTVERLGIAIGALGILLATYLIGRTVHGWRTGILAALMLASAPRFVMFSRRIFIDIWVTMFMALALACFLLADARPLHRRRYLLLMYAAIGLGVLTKGPVALVLPAAVFGAWLLIERRWADVRRMWIGTGALVILAIVLPWYIALYLQHGWAPIHAFWIGENVGRYTSSMVPGERGPFFYLPSVAGDLFPWSLFGVAGLVSSFRLFGPVARAQASGGAAGRRLLALWTVIIVGAFSFSATKQDLYVFPIMPALAVLAADFVARALDRSRGSVRVLTAVAALLTIGLGAGLAALFGSGARLHSIDGASGVAAVLIGGGLASLLAAWRLRPAAGVLTLAGAFVAANYVFVSIALPAIEAFKPVVPITQVLRERAGPGAGVAHYRTVLPSMVFYLGHPIVAIFDVETLQKQAQITPELYVLIRPHDFDEVRGQLTPRTCVVDRRTLFEAKLSAVLSGAPWPEIYLVGVGQACRD